MSHTSGCSGPHHAALRGREQRRRHPGPVLDERRHRQAAGGERARAVVDRGDHRDQQERARQETKESQHGIRVPKLTPWQPARRRRAWPQRHNAQRLRRRNGDVAEQAQDARGATAATARASRIARTARHVTGPPQWRRRWWRPRRRGASRDGGATLRPPGRAPRPGAGSARSGEAGLRRGPAAAPRPQAACAQDRRIYIPGQPAPGQGARGPRAPRRDGRVAEGARLESVYTGNRIVGSNPTPSAICH